MSQTNSLRYGFSQAPTAQFSVRDSLGAGIADAQTEQRNALLIQEADRAARAGATIREAAPAAAAGDQEAIRRMIAADPTQATALQQGWAGLDATRQQAAIRTTGIIGNAAAGLLALPADQRPAAYAQVRADLERQGVTGLPAAYPGDAIIEQRARAAVPAATTLATVDSRTPGTSDGTQPRGFRNNNPLNIEAGEFTRGQAGFQGSDGRFARFETMDQGIAAADALLQRYATTHGLSTVQGIIGRWAPSSDGNNVGAYATSVAQALGVRPDQQIDMNDPATRRKLIDAMAQHENGRPLSAATQRDPWTIVSRSNGEPAVRDNLALMEGPNGERVWRERPRAGYRYNAAGQLEQIPRSGRGGSGLPPAIQRLDSEDVAAIQTAGNISTDLGTVRAQLDRGEFSVNPFNTALYGAQGALGMSGPEGRAYSTFRATLEKMRNDSLRLNRGVQTEGDAQRAWNEMFSNLSDTNLVRDRLAEIERLNERARDQRLEGLNRRRRENGVPEIQLDEIWRPTTVLGGAAGGSSGATGAPAAGGGAAPAAGAPARGNPLGLTIPNAGGSGGR